MDDVEKVRQLLADGPGPLARQAGIELADEPAPLWQLLVTSQLLGARISSSVALRTARELFAAGWTTPRALAASTWQQRVDALGRGGYRRYDFSTSTRLGQNVQLVLDRWQGDLRRLRDEADGDPARITTLLQLFDGIGPASARIFLREVQGVWPSVAPQVDDLTARGASRAGLSSDPTDLAALVEARELPALCAALVQLGRARTGRKR